jgi:hypothetical protein
VRPKRNEWTTERPPDHAILVRGAPLLRGPTMASARKCFKEPAYGYYGLSVGTFPDSTPQEIATRYRLAHDDFCVCTAQDVRVAGYEVIMRDATTPGHASIVFADEPSWDDIDAVIVMFGDCQPNMTSASRRLNRPRNTRRRR